MDPLQTMDPAESITLTLSARSITALTGFGMKHEDDGITVHLH